LPRWWIELDLQLASNPLDGECIARPWPEGQIFRILLQGQRSIIQIEMRDDRLIEQRGRIARVLRECGGK